MKRVLTILLIFLMLALMLVSCGRRKTPGTTIIPTKTETETTTPDNKETDIIPIDDPIIQPIETETSVDVDYEFKHTFYVSVLTNTTDWLLFAISKSDNVEIVRIYKSDNFQEPLEPLPDSDGVLYQIFESGTYKFRYRVTDLVATDQTQIFELTVTLNLVKVVVGNHNNDNKLVMLNALYVAQEIEGTQASNLDNKLDVYYLENDQKAFTMVVGNAWGWPNEEGSPIRHHYYRISETGIYFQHKVEYYIIINNCKYSFNTTSTELTLITDIKNP